MACTDAAKSLELAGCGSGTCSKTGGACVFYNQRTMHRAGKGFDTYRCKSLTVSLVHSPFRDLLAVPAAQQWPVRSWRNLQIDLIASLPPLPGSAAQPF